MISFVLEDVSFKFSRSNLKSWIKDLILNEGKKVGDIALVLCSDEHILDVNRKYLDHDYYTDIITFDYCEGSLISGDLIISIDTVSSNALLNNATSLVEFYRVVFHGVLHLCGYEDKSVEAKELMTSKENFYLARFVSES